MSSEDSDWTISVYRDSERIMHYNCNWEEGEIVINDEELDMEIIKDLAASPISDEELNSTLYPEDEDALFDEIPLAYRIAAVLGLKRYDMLLC